MDILSTVEADVAAVFRTFKHLVAGSTTILASGKVLTFGGAQGKPGVYETSDPDEIAHLVAMTKSYTSQLVETTEAPEAAVRVDPAIAAAAADAAANTAADTNSQVAAIRAKLGAGASLTDAA